jgi:uncharacterized membrane protein
MPSLDSFLALPIHPAFVHFPVAMLTTAWAITLFEHLTGSSRGARFAAGAEAMGVALLPVVLLTGLRDAEGLSFFADLQWDRPLIWHSIIALLAAVLFAAHVAWRYRAGDARSARPGIDVGLSTAGFASLLLTGLIAGEMVYG